MKKLILGAILLFSILSCDGLDSKDELISKVLKIETEHLQRYNRIQKTSKDTATINYIHKLKDTLRADAFKASGTIEASSGIMIGSMTKSKAILEEYIKLCEN